MCETLMGTGKPGCSKGDKLLEYELNEPGGLWVDQKHGKVYIADTNNHGVQVLELQSKTVYNVRLSLYRISPNKSALPNSSSPLLKNL